MCVCVCTRERARAYLYGVSLMMVEGSFGVFSWDAKNLKIEKKFIHCCHLYELKGTKISLFVSFF